MSARDQMHNLTAEEATNFDQEWMLKANGRQLGITTIILYFV